MDLPIAKYHKRVNKRADYDYALYRAKDKERNQGGILKQR